MNAIKRYGGFLLLFVAVAGLLYTNLFVGAEERPPTTSSTSVATIVTSVSTSSTTTTTETLLFVDLKGAVLRPGVYPAKQGTRLYEIVQMAGGMLPDADSSMLNLAVTVYDAMVVMVPFKQSTVPSNTETVLLTIHGEVLLPGAVRVKKGATLQEAILAAGGATIKADLSGFLLSGVVSEGMTIVIPAIGSGVATVDQPASNLININTASLSVLVTLPGIGDILGQRIIDYRAEFGPFETIEDIMKVSGIKMSVYEQVKDRIRV
jgi:competence protein ComEA